MRIDRRSPGLRLWLIDLARRTRILPLRRPLADSQWHERRALQARQLEKLRRLLGFAAAHVPHYRKLMADLDIDPASIRSLSEVRRFPVLTKAEMRREPAAFSPRADQPRVSFDRRTGGSTGDPFAYTVSAAALSGQWAALLRAWEWSGYCFGDQMVTLGGGSVAPRGGGSLAHRIYHYLRRDHTLYAAALDEVALQRLADQIVRRRPALVYGYPSVLYRLGRYLLDAAVAIPGLRSVITTSEMLFPGQRIAIERAFGAPVFDVYGCNEVNLVCGECEAHEGYHQAMETALMEIVDDDGAPLPPGRVGRVVATALDNRSTVFL